MMTSPPGPPYGPYPPPRQQPHYPYPQPQHWALPPRQPIPVVVRPATRVGMMENFMWIVLVVFTCGLALPLWLWRLSQTRAKIEYR